MVKGLKFFFAILILFAKAEAQNYDESKVVIYTLPEVLKTEEGEKIKDTSSWEQKRRPEIVKLFEDHVYGQMPEAYDSLNYKITNEVRDAMDEKAHFKKVAITVWKTNKSASIDHTLFLPNNPTKRVPA